MVIAQFHVNYEKKRFPEKRWEKKYSIGDTRTPSTASNIRAPSATSFILFRVAGCWSLSQQEAKSHRKLTDRIVGGDGEAAKNVQLRRRAQNNAPVRPYLHHRAPGHCDRPGPLGATAQLDGVVHHRVPLEQDGGGHERVALKKHTQIRTNGRGGFNMPSKHLHQQQR